MTGSMGYYYVPVGEMTYAVIWTATADRFTGIRQINTLLL